MNLSALRRLLTPACCIYSICALLLCFAQLLITEDEMYIKPISFLMLFPFAVCFAGAELIRKNSSISAGMRLFGHFAVLTVGVLAFVFAPANVFSSGRSALVLICTYLLLYILIRLAIAAIRAWIARKRHENTSGYSAQYAELHDKK